MSEEKDFVQIQQETKRGRGRPKGSRNLNYEAKKKKREQEKAQKSLWKKGILHWKLDSLQKELYDLYYRPNNKRCVWSIGRQLGKSWTVCTIALEEAIRNPGIKMAYIAPEMNDALDITEQSFDQLCEELTIDDPCRPKYNSLRSRWEWQNGSFLKITGTDNKRYKKIRGRRYQRIFLDEFCFYDDFQKVFFSCIKPTLTSVPDHKVVFISTPPETADHESNIILDDAEEDGVLIRKTVYDCPRFNNEYIEENILKDYRSIGGINSVEFRREYMVERIADSSKLVIPEATPETLKSSIAEIPRPEYYTIVEAFDWGVMDWTAGLFAYVDYDTKTLVIEDEFFLDGVTDTTPDIARVIHTKEKNNWGDLARKAQRYCDNNLQIVNDMSIEYNLPMIATKKDKLHSQVQKVRQLLGNGQIIINPKCEKLIEHIQSAQWDKGKNKFVSKNGHHYDMVAALIYLVRNAQLEYDPRPEDWHLQNYSKYTSSIQLYNKRKDPKDNLGKHLENIFTIKKRR